MKGKKEDIKSKTFYLLPLPFGERFREGLL